MITIQEIIEALSLERKSGIVTYEAPIEYRYNPIVTKTISTDGMATLQGGYPNMIKFFTGVNNDLLVMEKNAQEVVLSPHFKIKKFLVSFSKREEEHPSGIVKNQYGYFGLTESGYHFSLIFNDNPPQEATWEDMVIGKTDGKLLEWFCHRLDIAQSYQELRSEISMKHLTEVLGHKSTDYKKTKI